jgi:hypothetical protein
MIRENKKKERMRNEENGLTHAGAWYEARQTSNGKRKEDGANSYADS